MHLHPEKLMEHGLLHTAITSTLPDPQPVSLRITWAVADHGCPEARTGHSCCRSSRRRLTNTVEVGKFHSPTRPAGSDPFLFFSF